MTPRLLAALLLLPLLLACSSAMRGRAPPPGPSVVYVAADLVAHLIRIQREFEVETVLCLTGRMHGDTLWIDGVDFPSITREEQGGADFNGCEDPRHLGLFHNHVGGGEYCGFSDIDLRTMDRRRQPFALVGCTGGRFAWRLGSVYGTIPGTRP